MALFSETSGFGQSGRRKPKASRPSTASSLVANETYGPKDTDMSPQLTKIKNAPRGPGRVHLRPRPGSGHRHQNYKQLGMNLPLYHAHGVASEEFIKLAGPAAEGTPPAAAPCWWPTSSTPGSAKPVVTACTQGLPGKWKTDVSTFGGHAYDGLMIAVDAIKRAGSSDKAKVRDALEATKGLHRHRRCSLPMSATDHMGLDLSAFRMLEIQERRLVPGPQSQFPAFGSRPPGFPRAAVFLENR